MQSVLPLPPASGFPHPVNINLEEEPIFDPKVHLKISRPDYVVTFPNMEKVKRCCNKYQMVCYLEVNMVIARNIKLTY